MARRRLRWESVSSAELEVHGIAGSAGPIAAPCESSVAENGNDAWMHVPRCSLRVALGI